MRVGPHPHAELTLSRVRRARLAAGASYARRAPPPRGTDAEPRATRAAGRSACGARAAPPARTYADASPPASHGQRRRMAAGGGMLYLRGGPPPPLAGHSRRATARLAEAPSARRRHPRRELTLMQRPA